MSSLFRPATCNCQSALQEQILDPNPALWVELETCRLRDSPEQELAVHQASTWEKDEVAARLQTLRQSKLRGVRRRINKRLLFQT